MRDGVITAIRQAARGQKCIRCKFEDETVVCAHYSGPRRLDLGGGLGEKVHDLISAHLCQKCHLWVDQLSKNKESRWEQSEEMLFLCAMTIIRLYSQGIITVKGSKTQKES